MTIVCATHFTDSSFEAVKVAAGLARRHRQPLWLVSVLPHRNTDDEKQSAVNDALLLEAAALSSEGLDVQTAVLHGPIERAVGQFCTDKKALLLVVGDTSHSASRLFAGTLDKFAYGVELPLLVVRDFKPFEQWVGGSGPLKVVLALDHTWSSAVARDWISRLSEYGPIDLVAAHVWWPAEEYARRALQTPPLSEGHAKLSALMLRETSGALEGLPANVKSRVRLEMGTGQIAQQLLALAGSELANVLVLGTNPHPGPLSLLRSVSHDVLMNAPMSVACIPGRLVLPGISSELREQARQQVQSATH
jgi:nucleotide-binding universal stress UspA family protein